MSKQIHHQRRTADEVIAEAKNQTAALKASCLGYDNGSLWEGPRLATTIANLINDSGKTKSILTQLGIRDPINFITYAGPNVPGNDAPHIPLCQVFMSPDKVEYQPILDRGVNRRRAIKFKSWWNEPVFENSHGSILSRMNLIVTLRNKEGGSHYDDSLPISPYVTLKEGAGGIYRNAASGGEVRQIPNAHLATVRHIAYELIETVDPLINSTDT